MVYESRPHIAFWIGLSDRTRFEYDKREGRRGDHERVNEYGFERRCVMTVILSLGTRG